jgi:hypothetical protein
MAVLARNSCSNQSAMSSYAATGAIRPLPSPFRPQLSRVPRQASTAIRICRAVRGCRDLGVQAKWEFRVRQAKALHEYYAPQPGTSQPGTGTR